MHTAFDPSIYQSRLEPYENDLARYYHHAICAYHGEPVALIGFACDQGVQRNQGRIGAKHAPNVIKNAFGKLPISHATQQTIAKLGKIGDNGNILCIDDDTIDDNLLENAQNHYAQIVRQMITSGTLPIGLGGGHEIAFGSFMGLYHAINTDAPTKKRFGIINLDTHFDLRSDKYATSGTPFLQISDFLASQNEPFFYLPIGISEFGNSASLFKKADDLGVQIISENDCHHLDFSEIERRITDFIAEVDVLYLTLDLDVLQAGFMPAVSAVNSSGLSVDFVERCLDVIFKSNKVKMADMAEFNPTYDIDGRGAKVAGRLLAVMISQSVKYQ